MEFMVPISASFHEFIVVVGPPWHVLFFKFMPFISPLLRCEFRMLIADVLELVHSNTERHEGHGLLKMRESVFVRVISEESLRVSVGELLH